MSYVRRYVSTDFSAVLELARRFHAESPVHSPFQFDDARVWNLLVEASRNESWLPLVCVEGDDIVGMALLFCVPMFFGPDLEVGDLSLYVTPDRRGGRYAIQLLEVAVEWARDRGGAVIRLGITTGIRDEAVKRLLEKIGFRQSGTIMQQLL